ncbi:MAG: recombinase RecT [Gemmatimonadales bacterium]|nr:recombinase RecT [Gemmatimonadales bacterium]
MSNPPATPMQDLEGLLRGHTKRFLGALGRSEDAVARFCSAMMSWAQRTPDLFDCLRTTKGRASLISSVLAAANVGLSLDGVTGQAYILPFKQRDVGMTATLIVGYRGMVQLMYRSGLVRAVNARAVFEGEPFEYELGIAKVCRHRPQSRRGRLWIPDLAKVTNVYAYFETTSGGTEFEPMTWGEVLEIKKMSRGAESKFSPWNSPQASTVIAMGLKTVLRRLAKWAPMAAQVQRVIASDESFDNRTMDFVMPVDDGVYYDVLKDEVEILKKEGRALPEPAVEREVPGVNAPAQRQRETAPAQRTRPATGTPEEERRRQEQLALLDLDAPIDPTELPD